MSTPTEAHPVVTKIPVSFGQSPEWDVFTLGNGLRVGIEIGNPSLLPAVVVRYRVGSGVEAGHEQGRVHLVEHLMFRQQGGFHQLVAKLGGLSNATTWVDECTFSSRCAEEGLSALLEAESRRMGMLDVTDAVLEEEQLIIEREVQHLESACPFDWQQELRLLALPPGHPYRHSTLGSLESRSPWSVSRARQFHRRHFGPANAVLAVAGAKDPEAVRAHVQAIFERVPRRSPPNRPAIEGFSPPSVRTILDEEAVVAKTWVAYALGSGTVKTLQHAERWAVAMGVGPSCALSQIEALSEWSASVLSWWGCTLVVLIASPKTGVVIDEVARSIVEAVSAGPNATQVEYALNAWGLAHAAMAECPDSRAEQIAHYLAAQPMGAEEPPEVEFVAGPWTLNVVVPE